MCTTGGRARDCASTMFEQRTIRVGNDRDGEAFCLLILKRFGFEKRNDVIKDRGITGCAHVVRCNEGKPEKIVTNSGAHASA